MQLAYLTIPTKQQYNGVFAGTFIRPLIRHNPYNPGTKIFLSMALVLKNYNRDEMNPFTFEDFISNGGVCEHLRIFCKKGYVEAF